MDFRILIVDDERLSRRYLRAMVAEFEPAATILEAESMLSAQKILNSEKVDILILDIMMPGSDGFKLLDGLPQRDFELVFVTAYSQFAIDALRQGAVDYLLKPVRKSDFRQVLQKTVSRRREKLAQAAYVRQLEGKQPDKNRDASAGAGQMETLRILYGTQILTEEGWTAFRSRFEALHPDFLLRLRNTYRELTQAEIRLIVLSKLRLTTREMAGMLGVSPETIRQTRWRLKKKIELPEDQDLDDLISAI